MDQPTRRLDQPDDDRDGGDTQPLTPRRPPVPHHTHLPCPKCQGATIAVLVHATQGRVELKRPDVVFGWIGGTSDLVARVCTECGYIEFYAGDLDKLLYK